MTPDALDRLLDAVVPWLPAIAWCVLLGRMFLLAAWDFYTRPDY